MRKTVALIEWNWKGHHPTFFNHYVIALEQLGLNVIAFCPNPDEALKASGESGRPTHVGLNHPQRIEFRKIQLPARRFRNLRPARIGAIDWTVRLFRGIERQISEWSGSSGKKVSIIFYACMYDWDFQWAHIAQPFLRVPWTGLYLQAMSYRMPGKAHPVTGGLPVPERMFGGRLCKGIGILDEGIAIQASEALGKLVITLPDLADGTVSNHQSDRELAQKMRRFADGRPIVGLFGHLQRSKGMSTFIEAARMPDAAGICFAIGGDVMWPEEALETATIQQALAECPNVWSHLARIPNEAQLNHLLAACDVVFAAYLDFPHSSGILAKAAVLKKPVIVSDGYLMAERTRKYSLGEIVDQDSPPQILQAILKITKDPDYWIALKEPKWQEYCDENTFEQFKARVSELVNA